jgi:hypothetical protein
VATFHLRWRIFKFHLEPGKPYLVKSEIGWSVKQLGSCLHNSAGWLNSSAVVFTARMDGQIGRQAFSLPKAQPSWSALYSPFGLSTKAGRLHDKLLGLDQDGVAKRIQDARRLAVRI